MSKLNHSFGAKVAFWSKFVRGGKKGEINSIIWIPTKLKRAGGVFLGYRTLSNGIMLYDNWVPETYFKAALVCFSPIRNPIYVPTNCLEALG